MRFFGILLFLSFFCGGEVLRVFVSIGPQVESVARIGGDLVEVSPLLPAGSNPETFSAGPRTLSALGRADLYLRLRLPFESVLVSKVVRTFPRLRMVDMTAGMEFRQMEGHEGDGSSGSSHHHHDGPDPHVWLSLGNMRVHAVHVRDLLTAVMPAHGEEFHSRCVQYLRELEHLDRALSLCLSRYRGQEVVVFHPAFGYFLDRYGLVQRAVELGGKEPVGRHLGALIRRAKRGGLRTIYVQPQFNRKASEVIAREIGGVVLTLDPLPESYSAGMLSLCRQLVLGFESSGS